MLPDHVIQDFRHPDPGVAAPTNIITYGDLVPILERRYGLHLSDCEQRFIESFELDFVRAVQERCNAPTRLLGAEYFLASTASLTNIAPASVIVIDDLYFDNLRHHYTLSVTRYFDALPPAGMCVGSRLSSEVDFTDSIPTEQRTGGLMPAILLDDGVHSGSTIEQLVGRFAATGAVISTVAVVVARTSTSCRLGRLWSNSGTTLNVLGLEYTDGWDHCRDLLGIHGLKLGTTGYVPYWNIPAWISLSGVDTLELASMCKAAFLGFAEYLADSFSVSFVREGPRLLPKVQGRLIDSKGWYF